MNPKVEIQIKLEARFKAPFHANMSAREMLHVWQNLVPTPVKAQFPEINDLFNTIATILDALDTAMALYVTAKQTYIDLQLAIETAAGILTGNPNSIVLAASEAAKAAEQVIIDQIEALPVTAFDLLMDYLY